MNPIFIANICFVTTAGGVVGAFMDKIEWSTAGYIFMGAMALAMLNGFLLASKTKKNM